MASVSESSVDDLDLSLNDDSLRILPDSSHLLSSVSSQVDDSS